jgi:hypothetical protein
VLAVAGATGAGVAQPNTSDRVTQIASLVMVDSSLLARFLEITS